MKSKKQIQKEIGCGDVYTIDEFNKLIDNGCINFFDGAGYCHDGEKETEVSCFDKKREKYPYIVWYNK